MLSSALNLFCTANSSWSGDRARRDFGNGAGFAGFIALARLFRSEGVEEGVDFLYPMVKTFGEFTLDFLSVEEGNWICSISCDVSDGKKGKKRQNVRGEGVEVRRWK